MNRKDLKRVSDKFRIFLDTSKRKSLPEVAIYVLVPSLSNLTPWYVGTSTDVVARYQKYVRGATKGSFDLRDSAEKVEQFKAQYESGKTPVMIVVDGATNQAKASELERQYKNEYWDKGHKVINHPSNPTSPKYEAQKLGYAVSGWAYDNGSFWLVLVIMAIFLWRLWKQGLLRNVILA